MDVSAATKSFDNSCDYEKWGFERKRVAGLEAENEMGGPLESDFYG